MTSDNDAKHLPGTVRGAFAALAVLAFAGLATAVDNGYSAVVRAAGAVIFVAAMTSLLAGAQSTARRRHEAVLLAVIAYGAVRLAQGHPVVGVGVAIAVVGIVLLERPSSIGFFERRARSTPP